MQKKKIIIYLCIKNIQDYGVINNKFNEIKSLVDYYYRITVTTMLKYVKLFKVHWFTIFCFI
jgi:hypothetical protein